MYSDVNNTIRQQTAMKNKLNITKLNTYVLNNHTKRMLIIYPAKLC